MDTTDLARVECAHGYILMQDSCPNCDAESEERHTPDPVKVKPEWATTTYTRCRNCGQVPSHRIHRA